jgi:hypothetical protein
MGVIKKNHRLQLFSPLNSSGEQLHPYPNGDATRRRPRRKIFLWWVVFRFSSVDFVVGNHFLPALYDGASKEQKTKNGRYEADDRDDNGALR